MYICSKEKLMNTSTVQINTKQPKFNFGYLLLFIVVLFALFLLSNLFTISKVAKNSPQHNFEKLTELAEEIYDAGTITDAINDLPLDASILAKMIAEIERILKKTIDYPNCELYFLQVIQEDNYPVLGYGNTILGFEYLKLGEVWKVGQTRNGEKGRYSSKAFYDIKQISLNLNRNKLEYITVETGSYKKILILEKLLIYTYPIWSGHIDLAKPPGCRIYR